MRSIAIGFATACLATMAGTGAAQTVTIQANVEGSVSGVYLDDSQGPANSGSLLASQSWGPGQGFTDPVLAARALAAQNDAGVSAVWVEAVPNTPNGDYQHAETHWSETVTHSGAEPSEYVYEFHVSPPHLALKDNTEGGPGNDSVTYEMEVRLNGNVIFQSSATLSGPENNPQLVKGGTDFGSTFFTQPSAHTYGYDFQAYDGLLSLGSYLPGQSLTVEAVLRVSNQINQCGIGAYASIGDPLDLGDDPGFRNNLFSTTFVSVESKPWSGIKALYR
jgi:hypothetical protein